MALPAQPRRATVSSSHRSLELNPHSRAQMSGASNERDGSAGTPAPGGRSHRGPQLTSDDEEEDERQVRPLGGGGVRGAVSESLDVKNRDAG